MLVTDFIFVCFLCSLVLNSVFAFSLSPDFPPVRFSPFFGRRQLLLFSKHQSPGVAEKFLVPLLDAVVPSKNQARNIYSEILGEIHECPLHQVSPATCAPVYIYEGRRLRSFLLFVSLSISPWSLHARPQLSLCCALWLSRKAGKPFAHPNCCRPLMLSTWAPKS